LHAGIAGRADAILIPEIPYDLASVAAHIKRKTASRGRQYSIIVVAEGAKPAGGAVTLKEAANGGHVERLGGVGEIVADKLRELTGKETRAVVLGHLLRGGQPTSLDRSLGLIFGAAAVRALVEGHDGVMVAVNPPRIDYIPLGVATAKLKLVAADDYGVTTARTLDVSFGD
jgi:6-phosphofructokinase 1